MKIDRQEYLEKVIDIIVAKYSDMSSDQVLKAIKTKQVGDFFVFLDLDSLEVIEFIMEIEDVFDVVLFVGGEVGNVNKEVLTLRWLLSASK